MAGFAAARLGGRVTDISHAVEAYVRAQGDYGIVEDYGGHGIGTAMHQPSERAQLRPPRPRAQAGRGSRWPSSRWSPSAPARPSARRRLDRGHRRRLLVRPLRAHLHAHPPRRLVLTALDGGEQRLASSASLGGA